MRQFLTTLSALWIAACIAAFVYSHQQHISSRVALAVTPAFLLELAFYLAAGFPVVRKQFAALGSQTLAGALLAVSGLAPYLIASFGAGTFHTLMFLKLIALVMVASFWYVLLRRGLPADLLFLAFMAAVYLKKPFDHIYGRLNPHVSLGILGQLMWIHVGLIAVLSLRGLEEARFGFLPTLEEWRVGVKNFVFFLPVGAALAYIVQLGQFHFHPGSWWRFALLLVFTFCGIFWVVSLAEEFFFRAFLQRIIARTAHSETIGLFTAAVFFGLAHLSFRKFPNWRLAIVSAALGVFCGLSLIRARSVRASMLTHALVATTWRMFFSG